MPPRKIPPNPTSIDVCDFTRSGIDRAIAKLRRRIQEVTNLHPGKVPFDDARVSNVERNIWRERNAKQPPSPIREEAAQGLVSSLHEQEREWNARSDPRRPSEIARVFFSDSSPYTGTTSLESGLSSCLSEYSPSSISTSARD